MSLGGGSALMKPAAFPSVRVPASVNYLFSLISIFSIPLKGREMENLVTLNSHSLLRLPELVKPVNPH